MKPEHVVRASCIALWAIAASCASKHVAPAKTKTEASVTPSAPMPANASAPQCNTTEPTALSQVTLAELVASWRKAQKAHDFAAYSALYAEHFAGLIAQGEGFARLDRHAWLRAHEAGLALDPELASAAPRVALGAGGARVTFDARSPRTSAPLPELFIVQSASGLKIAREAPRTSRPSELSASPGLWLADERFAILSTVPDPAWAEGAPSFAGDNSAISAVALARLPKALRAWLGRPVRVLGERGTVCETRLQRFAIRAQISPDLPTAEAWDGCADKPGPAPTAVAGDIWRLSAIGGRSLVAEFALPCKGALLAIDPELAAPAIAAPEPAAAELGSAALTAFRMLPAYARIQERFRAASTGGMGTWEDRESRRSVWSLALPGAAPLVFVSIEAGSGCASFSASLSALWAVNQNGASTTLTLLSVPSAEDERRLTPRALVDLGSRGGAALLLGPDGPYRARSLLSNTGAGYHRTLLTSVPFFAGPC